MKKIQEYIKFPEMIFSKEFLKMKGMQDAQKKLTKTFSDDYYFQFDENEKSTIINYNSNLLELDSYKLSNEFLFKMSLKIFENIKRYNIIKEYLPTIQVRLDNFESSINEEYTFFISNYKAFNFTNNIYELQNLGIVKKFYFNAEQSYWKYEFLVRPNSYSAIKFSIFTKFSNLHQKNIYFINVIKLQINKQGKSKYSNSFETLADLELCLTEQLQKLLLNSLKNKIERYLSLNKIVEEENIETYKKLVEISLY